MTPLQKRLQALEAQSHTNRAEEDREIDAVMALTWAQMALIPPAPGDTRTPEQRFEDAMTAETPTADDKRLIDALPDLVLSPMLRRSLMRGT